MYRFPSQNPHQCSSASEAEHRLKLKRNEGHCQATGLAVLLYGYRSWAILAPWTSRTPNIRSLNLGNGTHILIRAVVIHSFDHRFWADNPGLSQPRLLTKTTMLKHFPSPQICTGEIPQIFSLTLGGLTGNPAPLLTMYCNNGNTRLVWNKPSTSSFLLKLSNRIPRDFSNACIRFIYEFLWVKPFFRGYTERSQRVRYVMVRQRGRNNHSWKSLRYNSTFI